jgi:hypothetical protein
MRESMEESRDRFKTIVNNTIDHLYMAIEIDGITHYALTEAVKDAVFIVLEKTRRSVINRVYNELDQFSLIAEITRDCELVQKAYLPFIEPETTLPMEYGEYKTSLGSVMSMLWHKATDRRVLYNGDRRAKVWGMLYKLVCRIGNYAGKLKRYAKPGAMEH